MDVGFIGLGSMGKAMAANLLRAGHRLRVWNRSPGPAAELVKDGAQAVEQARDAAAGQALVVMLADDAACRSVILDSGLLAAAAPGLVVVNMSTVSVACARVLTAAVRDHGLEYVAAPVLGRPDVAAAGKLNIMAAGAPAAVARVQPLLDVLGQKTWPLGDLPERANAAKLAGNFMIAAAIEAMAEASTLVQGHGITAAAFLDVMTNTLFAAPVYKGYGAMIAEGRDEPAAFKLTLGLKDIRLALEAADGIAAPLPFASSLRDTLLEAVAHGDGGKDWVALANVAQRRAGQRKV